MSYLAPDAASLAASIGFFSIVKAFEAELGQISEGLLALNLTSLRHAPKQLRTLETTFFRTEGDARALATSLGAADDVARIFRHYRGTDFIRTRSRDAPAWYDSLVADLRQRLDLLRAKITDTASTHQSVSTALGTRANLRLQRHVAVVTYVIAVLTMLAALSGALAAHDELARLFHRVF